MPTLNRRPRRLAPPLTRPLALLSLSLSLSCAESTQDRAKLSSKQKSFEASEDFCLILGWYGDGHCDLVCDQPDLDCQESADPSTLPEYSAQEDVCAELGYYGDGMCDSCPQRDPDCDAVGLSDPDASDPDASDPSPSDDLCSVTWDFDDGYCDPFCQSVDPDCVEPPPPAEGEESQPAADPYGGDICLEFNLYNDGQCDGICLSYDPDCDELPPPPASEPPPPPAPEDPQDDLCERLGYYYDGECDLFCDLPDPDCE